MTSDRVSNICSIGASFDSQSALSRMSLHHSRTGIHFQPSTQLSPRACYSPSLMRSMLRWWVCDDERSGSGVARLDLLTRKG